MNKNRFFKALMPLALFFAAFSPVLASSIVEQTEEGFMDLNELIKLGVNISVWILGISGSAALLAFVVGGLMFLISGGSSENVARGKAVIKAAIIGLIVVFASWMIINFIMVNILGYDNGGEFGSWYSTQ